MRFRKKGTATDKDDLEVSIENAHGADVIINVGERGLAPLIIARLDAEDGSLHIIHGVKGIKGLACTAHNQVIVKEYKGEVNEY